MSGTRIGKMPDGGWQVCGELSFASVPDLLKRSEALFEPGHNGLLRIDLSGVSRADSAGLALLVCWIRQARRRDIPIEFHHVPGQMLKIARVSGLSRVLPLNTG